MITVHMYFMNNALKGQPERQFPIPNDIRFESIDVLTGCSPGITDGSNETFIIPLKSDQTICQSPEGER